jgi:hypothetical protein
VRGNYGGEEGLLIDCAVDIRIRGRKAIEMRMQLSLEYGVIPSIPSVQDSERTLIHPPSS